MIQTGHGRPLFAALVLLTVLLAAAPAAPAASRDNVVEIAMPRPAADQIVLARVQVKMGFEARVAQVGRLNVRRAGRVPAGFAVAAVRARQRGDTVTVRLAAVRTSSSARSGGRLRVKLRVGAPRHTYERAVTSTVPIGPGTRVRRHRDCATINGEAARWQAVRGLSAVRLEGIRFSARTAIGAALELACERDIRTVAGTDRFLVSVDRDFAGGGGGVVEGFYATWARDAAGNPRICVYVRGRRGGEGDVTVASTTQRFELDDARGVARADTPVAGEGEYAFKVRWRQPDGTYRESESTLRVPADGQKGNDPAEPYSAAGNCG
jgi:hypothetical protein